MTVTDPPEQEQPRRVYAREWSPPAWRGSLDEIVGAARAAIDELDRQQPTSEIAQSVSLEYGDESTQDFGSLDALQESAQTIDPGEITGLSISAKVLYWNQPQAVVEIEARGRDRLGVKAEGTQTFASGMVATLKSRLAGGAEAGEQAVRVSLKPLDRTLTALIWAAAAVMGGILAVDRLIHNLPRAALIALAVGGFGLLLGFGWGWRWLEGERKKREPSFTLVREGEQFPDEGENRTGPVWKARAWFRKHPAVALTLVLVVGALLGRAADLIRL